MRVITFCGLTHSLAPHILGRKERKLTSRGLTGKLRQRVKIYAVVSGSFKRFLPQIQEAVNELSSLGINVISPKINRPVSQIGGFVMLEEDKGTPGDIEGKHLEAIAKSDFLYIVNPEGYIGESVALEIGYALSRGVPVYSSEHPRDEVFSSFLVSGVPLSHLKRRIAKWKNKLAKVTLKPSPTLADLQDYVAKIVKARGFSEEGLTDVALLLVEEVGELAKAIRFKTGLKLAAESLERVKSLDSELADCLVYLLDLANLSNVDLEQALRAKEAINAQKKWVRGRLNEPRH